jgi:mRNA-degrading endonuclease RelE of RelBE toxin-antitoxin system
MYELVFDEIMIKQLKKIAKNNQIKKKVSKMLDRLEHIGPLAGKLLDSKLFIYELKSKNPPLRLYFKHNRESKEIYVFEYSMKKCPGKQQETIDRIRSKA